ncbi:PhnB protein [Kibdelosporangium banguiense]|uniref:PhnB protein n=1 Tax=Kibdelosporangium banguiense TaxID=1365924 RepID=A0ABS4U103_9PSEU|nr:VOC family protein [Kibdelosporangium banguiense]MBP2330306.1 PhnB protein [Kibdelosporangium banguiense]
MASRLNPYLNFPGTAREAMTFYQEVLGGDLVLNTFEGFTPEPTPFDKNIMHAQLDTSSGYTLMGSDGPPGGEVKPGNNFSVSISGDDAEELRGYFTRLSEGGTVNVPLEKQAWGDEFGSFTDRFGIEWMVNITQPQA